MKIAITLEDASAGSPLDRHFGRCRAFALCESDGCEIRTVDNSQNYQAAQGAGIQSAQNVLREGAGVVITGSVGPKAFRVLAEAGVKVYHAPAGVTVAGVIEAFRSGILEEIKQANGVGPMS